MKNIIKNIIKNRIIIQGIIGLTIYVYLFVFNISLKWIVLAGIITGIFMGKAFCRWICPIGFLWKFYLVKKMIKVNNCICIIREDVLLLGLMEF
ncbi:4Fe-4S binding protein [Caloramator sp. Dgby_cultured_2]|uniref:4Fe-4S binding protein n=1 Tax=Caloramator sp. Dgby_cultured_2 TaxID=3029174 RepID=UPI00237E2081|nr:4Fe-4S binding protein [Caloramator sp. Dgby_cultured_2]WDU84105.1 4Fe-4S binding protein [Caloramator sp. Dgby_cultured_2]